MPAVRTTNPIMNASPVSGPSAPVSAREWLCLALILAVGAWLRFMRLDLIEFKGDEALAAWLALQFVKGGSLPLAGLMSSVGVTNPPVFIYLLVPMLLLSGDPTTVGCLLVIQSLVAILVCWHVGRKYYGHITGLVAAALFAVSPWAVIYSRKIWAIDVEPLLACLTIWALHALILERKTKAIFWVAFLSLCLVMNHFSGLGLLAAVLGTLALLRPKLDWRWAAAGVLAAGILLLPYLKYQQLNHWADLQQARQTVGGQKWNLPPGMTINPESGHRLPRPRNELWMHALAIFNSGEIEDVLGLGADRRFDPYQIFTEKHGGSHRYFSESQTLGDSVLVLQRFAFVIALVWLAVRAVRSWRWSKRFPFVGVVEDSAAQSAWILVLWAVSLLVVFGVGGLWTYLPYFVILYPVHFLVVGIVYQEAHRRFLNKVAQGALYIGLGAMLLWNVVYLLDFYRVVNREGGAFGTYGTTLSFKKQAAQFLVERGGQKLVEDSRAQLDLLSAKSLGREPQVTAGLRRPMLVQMDNFGRFELPQTDLPYLIWLDRNRTPDTTRFPTNLFIVVVDENRVRFSSQQWEKLASAPQTNFGPMHLLFMTQ